MLHGCLPLELACCSGASDKALLPLTGSATVCPAPAQSKLQAAPEIAGDSAVVGSAAAALQIARSTPYVITAIVGQKDPRHVDENLRVVRAELLDRHTFTRIMDDV